MAARDYHWPYGPPWSFFEAEMVTTPYGIVHSFPGGTREQYLSSITAVHPGEGQLPAGQISMQAAHLWAVGRSWQCMNRRRAGRHSGIQSFSPKMEAGIKGGFETMPVETVIDLITVMPQKYMGD